MNGCSILTYVWPTLLSRSRNKTHLIILVNILLTYWDKCSSYSTAEDLEGLSSRKERWSMTTHPDPESAKRTRICHICLMSRSTGQCMIYKIKHMLKDKAFDSSEAFWHKLTHHWYSYKLWFGFFLTTITRSKR